MGIVKNIMNKYISLSISSKFYSSLIFISIIPMLFILVVSFFIINETMKKQVDDFTSFHLQQSFNNVALMFNGYKELITDMSNDTPLIEEVGNVSVWGKNYAYSKHKIYDMLRGFAYLKNGLLGMAVIANNGEAVIYDLVTLSTVESYCIPLDTTRQHKENLDTDTAQIHMSVRIIQNAIYGNRTLIYMEKPLKKMNRFYGEPIGNLLFSMDEQYIEKLYTQDHQNWLTTLILSNDGVVLSSPTKELIGKNIFEGTTRDPQELDSTLTTFINNTGLWKNKKLLVHRYTKEDANFFIATVMDASILLGKMNSVLLYLLFFGCVLISFSVLITHYTTKHIKGNVRKIMSAMRRLDLQNFDIAVEIHGNDEFAKIGKSFNYMIAEVERLTKSYTEAVYRQKEFELQALEAQINPHFLYNTLDSINWMAIKEEKYDISEMLTNLADLLRYSIHGSNHIVALSEDMGYIKKYLLLQQKRFNYSFDCFIQVSEGAKVVKIHKLLLQPFIENILKHGFPGKTGQDAIYISVDVTEEQELLIKIEDNGVGIPQEKIDRINDVSYTLGEHWKHIGIRNVRCRLEMYYGKASQLIISNSDYGGTKVVIRIPLEKNEIEG